MQVKAERRERNRVNYSTKKIETRFERNHNINATLANTITRSRRIGKPCIRLHRIQIDQATVPALLNQTNIDSKIR